MRTQRERLEELLSDGRWHSGAELNRVCFRYGARIHEMRADGLKIEKRYPKNRRGNPAWEYRMAEEGADEAPSTE